MERNIKFRGLRTDGKGWVYGSLILPNTDNENTYIQVGNGVGFKVKPESVCQFTGLKDKNKVDIYDGDILISNMFHKTWIAEFTPCDGLKLCIKYNEDFHFEGIFQTHEDWSHNKVSSTIVIGNIHENENK